MKTNLKVIIPLFACLLTLTGCNNPSPASSSSVSPEIVIDPEAYGGYYAPYVNDLGTEGSTLQFNLHKLLLNTHTTAITYQQFYTYVGSKAPVRSVDASPTDQSKMVLLYSGAEISTSSSSFTREHVWPCAASDGLWVHKDSHPKYPEYFVDNTSPSYWGGGSDLYHIRPTNGKVNTARGSSRFIEFPEGEPYYEATCSGGKYALKVNVNPNVGYASLSEPADQIKGDIVRILMYVFIHYSKIGGKDWCWYYDANKTISVMGNLSLQSVFGYNDMEDIYDLIVRWNRLDPVDDIEKLRNDTVQQIQGNRNPFVDYPELITKCFGL